METTVDLEAGFFKTARKQAIDQGRPFGAVLNDALRAYLDAAAAARGTGRSVRPSVLLSTDYWLLPSATAPAALQPVAAEIH